MKYDVEEGAFVKIFLHGIKYPHTCLNGLLIGRRDADAEIISVQDAIPLQVPSASGPTSGLFSAIEAPVEGPRERSLHRA